ncbi:MULTISPECIES: head-tail connector protein [Hyphomicrobiales]|jgi:uncharacterized phage protein (predicted DNA packaging)|uniref:head-tail connector protein n=1 Tax=Methylobacterium sp. CCH7-A2 TaxID=1768789 RepID=UPI00082B707C|nr:MULTISPECIES: head-tail connector protein [Hyphomicrobiales]
MAIVDLADMKAHLNITDDNDDSLISGKLDAAQAALEQQLGYVIEDEFDDVPADLAEAVRQLAAHWYENREASVVGVSVHLLPLGVREIIRERRNYSWS